MSRFWIGSGLAAAFLLLLPFESSAESVSMQLTGAGNNVMAGVYVNPYDGTIDGVSVKLICDAFSQHSYIGETWTADVTDLSDLSNTLNTKNLGLTPEKQTLYYNQAAWLATQLIATADKKVAGEISFALWSIFDSSAMPHLATYSPGNVAGAQDWVNRAKAQTFTPGQFSNVLVYSPNMNYPILCGGRPCASIPPQEFLVVKVPEPSSIAILLVDLAAAGIIMAAVQYRARKRRRA
jgi:hypothetical protein